jgi:hypothetical protein
MANPNFDNQFAQDPITGEKVYGNDPRVLAVQQQWKAKGVDLNPDVIMGNLGAYGVTSPKPAPTSNMEQQAQPGAQVQAPAPASQAMAPQQQSKNPAEAFYARASEMLGKAQNYNGMKDLIDARNALVSAKNASVMAMTPEELRRFPPEVQEAMRNMGGSGIDQQIQAINGAMQARQNQQVVMKEAYNQAFALAKEFELTQSKTKDDARAWMQQLIAAGVAPSQDEYQYLIDTGSVPDSMMPKLQKAIAAKNLLDQQKAAQGTYGFMKDDNGSIYRTDSATGAVTLAQQGSSGASGLDFSKFDVKPSMSLDEFISSKAPNQSITPAKRSQLESEYKQQIGTTTNPAESLYQEFKVVQLSLPSVNSQKSAEAEVQRYLANGDLKGLQKYVDGAAKATLTGAQKTDFSKLGAYRDEAIGTLAALQQIKDYNPGPYKALLESAKPWSLMKKDPTYTDMVARIEQAQASYRNSLYGASLTDNEKAISDQFLVNPKDDIGSIEIKLKNGIQHASDMRERLLRDASGNFSAPTQNDQLFQQMKKQYPNATDQEIRDSLTGDLSTSGNGSPTGKIVSVNIGTRPVKVDASISDKLASADADFFAATGKHIQVNQDLRTSAQQQALYDKFKSGKGGRAAPPGKSFHEKGLAVDVTNWKDAMPYLKKYGFQNPLADDKGHFSVGEFS